MLAGAKRSIHSGAACRNARGRPSRDAKDSGCARIKILLVAFAALFADGKRNGAVRVLRMDGRDNLADEVICVERVLAALQNERAKAEVVPLRAAGENLLFR